MYMPNPINRRMARFLIVGAGNTLVGYGTILLFTVVFQQPFWISNAAGYGVGLTFSFISNRIWTFQAAFEGRQVPKYLLSFAVCYVLQFILLYVLIRAGLNSLVAQLLSILAYTGFNFILQNAYVFHDGLNTGR